jgi:hypothetical protein
MARKIFVTGAVIMIVACCLGIAISQQEAQPSDKAFLQLLARMDQLEQNQKQTMQKLDMVLANQQKILSELDIVKIRATRR